MLSLLIRYAIRCVFAIVLSHGLLAQTHIPLNQRVADLRFEHLAPEDGLSQSSVGAIIQDSRGLMWFGTDDGLNCYDGYSVKVYRYSASDSMSLPDNWIEYLYLDSDGTLWVGTFGGLSRYDAQLDVFYRHIHDPDDTASISHNSETSMLEDSRGNFWITTFGGGLNLMDRQRGKFVHFRHDPVDTSSISSDFLARMCEDSLGNIWVADQTGVLNRFNLDSLSLIYEAKNSNIFTENHGPSAVRFHRYMNIAYSAEHSESNIVWALLTDRHGHVWAGSDQLGLIAYDPQKDIATRYQKDLSSLYSLGSNTVLALVEDPAGGLWVGTGAEGLYYMDQRTRKFYHSGSGSNEQNYSDAINIGQTIDNLQDRTLWSLYIDAKTTLWVGTNWRGVAMADNQRRKFRHYVNFGERPYQRESNRVWAIVEDEKGFIWIGTEGAGLIQYDPARHKFQSFLHDPDDANSIASNVIRAIIEGEPGILWIGTEGGGLSRFDTKTKLAVTYRHDAEDGHSLSHNQVRSLHMDKDNMLWVGTFGGGLNRLDQKAGQFEHIKIAKADSSVINYPYIAAIYQDHAGTIWIGTYYGGAIAHDPVSGVSRHYQHTAGDPRTVSGNRVFSIHQDEYQTIWIGTGSGLNRYDNQRQDFTRYSIADGLPSDVIYSILGDDSGRLWISTGKGLSRFNIQEEVFHNFTLADGLQGYEFNREAATVARSGQMYFGGVNGFNEFYPDSIQLNIDVPPVIITEFKVFGERQVLEQPSGQWQMVTLPFDQNFFSFEFAALDYTATENNRYAYQLQGYDKDWIYSDSRRFANYTGVPPGEYTFRVKGSNSDGVWNEQGAAVQITITPPFWATWWFRTLVVALILVIGYGIHRFRLKQLLKIERMRTGIARDLHDDLGATLSSISMFAEAVERAEDGNARQRFLGLIKEGADEAKGNVHDIIWSISNEVDSWEATLARYRRYATDLLESNNIEYNLNIPTDIKLPLPNLDLRRDLWLIFKEMLTNSVRHAEASRVTIVMSAKSSTLIFSIADNGLGFNPASANAGNGLANIRARARRINAEVILHTLPEQGTTWKAKLKL